MFSVFTQNFINEINILTYSYYSYKYNKIELYISETDFNRYYVSIIPDRYRFVPFFITDRPFVSIRTDIGLAFCFHWNRYRIGLLFPLEQIFFLHDGEELERSDYESDTRCIG